MSADATPTDFFSARLTTRDAMLDALDPLRGTDPGVYRTTPAYLFRLLEKIEQKAIFIWKNADGDMVQAAFKQYPTEYKVIGGGGDLGFNFKNAGWLREHHWPLLRELLRFLPELDVAHIGKKFDPRVRQTLPYKHDLYESYGVILNPLHFVHISPKNPAYIRYHDERSLEKDAPIETTIGKYLRKFFPHLTVAQLRDIATHHKLACTDRNVRFLTKLEDIIAAYEKGPPSCMSKELLHYDSHIHPLAVFADRPEVALAVLPQHDKIGGTGFSARAWVFKKGVIRMYGDVAQLQALLLELGYTTDVAATWGGASLAKIPALDREGGVIPVTWVMPYLDDMTRGSQGDRKWLWSTPGREDWLVSNSIELCPPELGNERGIIGPFQASTTDGLVGRWNYDPSRHAYWRKCIDADNNHLEWPNTNGTTPNELGEVNCQGHGHPVEFVFTKPFVAVDKDRGHICRRCLHTQLRNMSAVRVTAEEELYATVNNVVAIPNDPGLPVVSPVRTSFIKPNTLRDYRFVLHADAEKYGLIQLAACENVVGLVQLDPAKHVKTKRGWLLRENLVMTVVDIEEHKTFTWFLGQRPDEALQFFPQDMRRLKTAFLKGRFFVAGDKIVYEPKGTFQAARRQEFFQQIGELAEDDEGQGEVADTEFPFFERTPLVEFLNVVTACYDNNCHDITMPHRTLKNLLPRVNEDFLDHITRLYRELSVDEFAGVEGVTRLQPQYREALGDKPLRLPRIKRDLRPDDFITNMRSPYYIADSISPFAA